MMILPYLEASFSERNYYRTGTPLPTKDFAQLEPTYIPLLATAQRYGHISIIVGFRVTSPNPSLEEITQGRQQLLDQLAGHQAENFSDLLYVPYIAMTVDDQTLQYLITLPEVTSIEPNWVASPDLEVMSTAIKPTKIATPTPIRG